MAVPNFYAVLSVSKTASFDEIKTAYKKESLRCHPDRLPPTATEAERTRSTARFQVVADAYYTLSDPVRRREYDLHVPQSTSFPSDFPEDPDAEPFFSSAPPPSASSTSSFFSNLFGAATSGTSNGHADAEATFTSVFADLLEPEVGRERHGRMWSLVGGAGGAACGFIVGNLPGAAAGAFAGNRLGAIRDAKGKAVGEVFMSLGSDRKAEILRALAAKVFATLGANAMGGSVPNAPLAPISRIISSASPPLVVTSILHSQPRSRGTVATTSLSSNPQHPRDALASQLGPPSDLPSLEASAYPRKAVGQLWGEPTGCQTPSRPQRYTTGRAKPGRATANTSNAAAPSPSSSTGRRSRNIDPSSSSSGSDPETPAQQHGQPELRALFKVERTGSTRPEADPVLTTAASTPRHLGSFPLLFELLRTELTTLGSSSPPAIVLAPPLPSVVAVPPPPPVAASADSSDSDVRPSRVLPRKRVRRAVRAKRTEIFSLPSFADLAVPLPVIDESPQKLSKGRGSLAASVMLQLRSVEEKLVREFPAESAAVRRAVETEREHLEAGVPKTIPDELEALRLQAQSQTASVPVSERPVHVFVDHSNILVGLISLPDLMSDGSTPLPPGSKARLSHLPLSLVLTRGRPAATLSVVGSSPLWQLLDQFEARGWDICLLQRVRAALDVGPSGARGSSGSSAEEDKGGSHRRQRAVMKEQAVDEMLQLKMLLAISLFPPSVLILATGDSAGSHLNPLGFAGVAELALKKGWEVELCAWGGSIGRSWRELERVWGPGGRQGAGSLRIRPLDQYREELEEI